MIIRLMCLFNLGRVVLASPLPIVARSWYMHGCIHGADIIAWQHGMLSMHLDPMGSKSCFRYIGRVLRSGCTRSIQFESDSGLAEPTQGSRFAVERCVPRYALTR